MACRKCAFRTAQQCYKPIARVRCPDGRTRLIRATRSIHLSRRDPGNPDLGSFGAPDRSIAVVNSHRRAFECEPGRNHSSAPFGLVCKRRERWEGLRRNEGRKHEREREFGEEAHIRRAVARPWPAQCGREGRRSRLDHGWSKPVPPKRMSSRRVDIRRYGFAAKTRSPSHQT